MDTISVDDHLNALIIQNGTVDAFTEFCAEDVVAQENDEPERVDRKIWMQS